MADVDPVVVPVVLKAPDPSVLDQLGQATRRARETFGPAAGDVEAGGLPSVRNALRELGGLERTVAALNVEFQRLARNLQAFQPGGVPAVPVPAPGITPTTPTLPAPPSVPGVPGAPRVPRVPMWQQNLAGLLQQAVLGTAGTLGAGFGLSAVFGELSGWIRGAQEGGVEAALATMRAGGGAREYKALIDTVSRPDAAGLRPLTGPLEQMRTAATLAGMGISPDRAARDAVLLGEVGLRAFGSGAAGGALGAEAFRTYRTELIPEYLATLVQQGAASGKNIGELVSQFQSLIGLSRAREGQYERGRGDLEQLLATQATLNALPGGIGKGEGGVELLGALTSFGQQGGLEGAITLRAYMQATGRGYPQTAEEVLDYEEWLASPQNAIAKANAIRQLAGPTMGAFILAQQGLRIPVARRLMQEPITEARVRALTTPEEAARFLGEENQGLAGTLGGGELDVRAARERQHLQEGEVPLPQWQQDVRRLLVDHWAAMMGGMFLGSAALGLGGGRVLARNLPRLFRLLFGGGGTAAGVATGAGTGTVAAGGTTAAGAGLLARFLRALGPTAGAAGLTKDLVDAIAGGDETNILDLAFGLTGALVGGGIGLGAGGVGVLPGALTGYAAGKGLAGAIVGLGGDGSDSVNLHDPAFRATEARYGLPRGLLSAIAQQESRGNPNAVGPPIQSMGGIRARGLFQFIPPTAAMLGIDPADPNQALEGAGRYMRQLLDRTGGDVEAALNLYGGDKTRRVYGREVMARIPTFAADPFTDAETIAVGSMPAPGQLEITLWVHADPGLRVHGEGEGVTVRQIP